MSREAAAHPAWLSLPNLVTLSRLPMAGLVWLRPLDPFYVLGLMALAGLSDVLDGWLERRRRQRLGIPDGAADSIGTWLDPLCDKVFILSVLMAITAAHALPWWIIPLLALREILQTLIVLGTRVVPALQRSLRPRFKANLLGKLTTVVQFAAIGAILQHRPGVLPLALATAALGMIAVAVYVRRAIAV
jgi:phosphatidylglycerophosphate synthase